MKLLLKLKHWQLFILGFLIPFSLFTFNMISIISKSNSPGHFSDDAFNQFKYLPILVFIVISGLFIWQWTVAKELNKHLPEGVRMNLNRLRIFMIIPGIYILAIIVFFFLVFTETYVPDSMHVISVPMVFSVVIPIHLFYMFCIFHNIQFLAKSYKSVKLQREVTAGDYIGDFFLFWFLFVGIWFIQPKINKLVEGEQN